LERPAIELEEEAFAAIECGAMLATVEAAEGTVTAHRAARGGAEA
jgi:hypothetical protein